MKEISKKLEDISILIADESHIPFIPVILKTMSDAAKVRGTGISQRQPEYIKQKMVERKAIIALTQNMEFAGFCYIESWSNKDYVANSGLIVVEKFRGHGLAKRIKKKAFQLSRERFPNAKIFGITTGLAVMKINSELGYRPVPYSELTDDDEFWKGCESCPNYDILQRTNRKYCLCTGMLYDPGWEKEKEKAEEKNKPKVKTLVVKPVKKPTRNTAKMNGTKRKVKRKPANLLKINLF